MKTKATRLFVYLTALIVFTAANAFAGDGFSSTRWKLVEANGSPVTNSLAALEINEDGSRFTGNTGCNRMFGELSVDGRKIDLRSIGTTKRMCKLMEGNVAESVFLKALDDTRTFRSNGRTLRLIDRRGRVVLKFTKVEPDKLGSFENNKWVLESIMGRQTSVPLPYAFIKFDEQKSSAGGNTSCNVFGGSYSVEDSSIRFTDIISTMRACIEDSSMAVEQDMLAGLRNSNRYEIKDGRLFLYDSMELLLTFRGENE
ncbi:MAG: META domain-containing protein [Pyrinomonadaceae bacterium]